MSVPSRRPLPILSPPQCRHPPDPGSTSFSPARLLPIHDPLHFGHRLSSIRCTCPYHLIVLHNLSRHRIRRIHSLPHFLPYRTTSKVYFEHTRLTNNIMYFIMMSLFLHYCQEKRDNDKL